MVINAPEKSIGLCGLIIIFTIFMYVTYQPRNPDILRDSDVGTQTKILELQKELSVISYNMESISNNLIKVNNTSKITTDKIDKISKDLEKTSKDIKKLQEGTNGVHR